MTKPKTTTNPTKSQKSAVIIVKRQYAGNLDMEMAFVMTDIAQKYKDGIIQAVPTTYRLDFKNNAIDEVINQESEVSANA
jgi:hypothetical protein